MNDAYLPAEIKNFQEIVESSLELLKEVDADHFSSPYSAVPLISQMLGVNTPLMGSGDSPYSIISISFLLQKKAHLFRKLFEFPLAEKRKVIDEIYEMIAPSLLREEDTYIDLLINTRYRRQIKSGGRKIIKSIKAFKEKFSILSSYINRFHCRRGDFGYIVHYGYPEDLYREYSFLEYLPKSLAEEWRRHSLPIVNETVLSNFPYIDARSETMIKGWIIFVTNYTKELLEDGKLRKRKIFQAAKLAEILGAKIIGMGGLIASFAQGGWWLSRKIPNVGFTTGHAYTIGNILEIMRACSRRVGLNIKKSTVAIVGAAGSIGSGCAKLLAEKQPKEIILIDLNTFNVFEKLEELRKYIIGMRPQIKVGISHSFADCKRADVLIIATNSPTTFISSEVLKQGAIVIDDSFPKNVSKELLNERKDIILVEGGIMQLPSSIDVSFARNMPDLMDTPLTRAISCKETYGCVAETLALALQRYKKNYGLGYSDPQLAKDILRKAKKVKFSCAPLQCYDEAIEEKRCEMVSKIIKRR